MNGGRLPAVVRSARPLVHAITNYVTMDWVARGLLAAGARPVMSRDIAEVAAVAEQADALVLNLGTWSPALQEAMLEAGRVANARSIPVVLDPVGAGMPNRTTAALQLLRELRVAVIRGNAGEIAALAGQDGQVRGVDGLAHNQTAALQAASQVARRYGCIVAATGPIDVVTDGRRSLTVRSGHPLMAEIPGAGCLTTALIGATLGAQHAVALRSDASVAPPRPLDTVAETLLWAGVAGEEAGRPAPGPGTFAAAYLDGLAGTVLPSGRIAPPLADRLAVYVIVSGSTPLATVEAILASGVGAIQFREKHLPLPQQVTIASEMCRLCQAAGALFLINDRVDLALAVGADGVHLGQDDLPVAAARRVLGPRAVIGATCETPDEARIATAEGADYIGTGPVYATLSKADAGEPYGPAVVERVSAATSLPVVGIGGIGIGGAAPVIQAGGCGVAVISSVVGAADPGAAAGTLLIEVVNAKEGIV